MAHYLHYLVVRNDFSRFRMSRRGMTMVEVITVVAVIGMLAAMAMPNLEGGRDRRAANSAARQAMMVFRLARSQAIRRQKNVLIQFSMEDGEIRVYTGRDARDFSMYSPLFHVTLRMLSSRLRRGEDKRDWPKNIKLGSASIADGLMALPEAYASATPKSCSFCARGLMIIATPQGRFIDFSGQPLVGSFSVARLDSGGRERIWLTRLVAFNGLTGSSRVFSWRGDGWR
jgi:prepilin-type N-terminal cleavage/methylation domain-containing protein